MVFDVQTAVLLGMIFLLLIPYVRRYCFSRPRADFIEKTCTSDAPTSDSQSRAQRQLAAIQGVPFQRKQIMNPGEFWAFKTLEEGPLKTRPGLRLFAQVSLGEILRADGYDAAFAAINCKRVDLLIVERDGTPLLAVEYQGPGHKQGDALIRDAIKKQALRSAGIEYLEAFPGNDALIHNQAVELLDQVRKRNGTLE